jgi:hypothetical protein
MMSNSATEFIERVRVSVDPFNDRLYFPGVNRKEKGEGDADDRRVEGKAPAAPEASPELGRGQRAGESPLGTAW